VSDLEQFRQETRAWLGLSVEAFERTVAYRARVAQHTFGDYNYHLDRFAQLSGF